MSTCCDAVEIVRDKLHAFVAAVAVVAVALAAPGGAQATTKYGVGLATDGWSHLHMFTVGVDDAVWARSWTPSGWQEWYSLGGVARSAPHAIEWRNGRVDVFVRSTSNTAAQ